MVRTFADRASDAFREALGDLGFEPADGTRQAVHDRVKRRRLIRLRARDGHGVFPLFQFDRGTPPADALLAAHAIVAAQADGWTAAAFLVRPQPELDGCSPVAWLRANPDADPEPVLLAARRAAFALAA